MDSSGASYPRDLEKVYRSTKSTDLRNALTGSHLGGTAEAGMAFKFIEHE